MTCILDCLTRCQEGYKSTEFIQAGVPKILIKVFEILIHRDLYNLAKVEDILVLNIMLTLVRMYHTKQRDRC